MSKKGVSVVSGNISPVVGEKQIYHIIDWYPDTPKAERNPANVTWELFRKRSNGKFTTTHIKKKGDSSFTFGEASLGNTYRLEGYLHQPEGGGLIITPKPNKIPQIGKVELFYVDDTKGSTFSFMEKLRARAYCINMFNKELVFTLWEDDSKGTGHSESNKAIDVQKARVNENGVAVAEFMLTKALMKKAIQGEADSKQLEFYVTVEYYKNKKHATENAEIDNPYAKYYNPKPYEPPVIPKAKGSPAEQKPKSKKEEKGILDAVTDKLIDLWDWKESKGTVTKDKVPTVQKQEGRSVVVVKEQETPKTNHNCVCKSYDLIWGEKVSCEFRKKVVEICTDLWGEDKKILMANGMMAVMYVESATTFSASKIELKPTGKLKSNGNPIYGYRGLTKNEILSLNENFSGAVGLIQFTPAAINALNKEFSLSLTKRQLALMTEIEQLNYVKKYFQLDSANTKIKTSEDIYLHVFAPEGINKSEDYVLYERHTNPTTKAEKTDNRNYNANKSVDNENNNDGKIQRSEILGRYRTSFVQGLTNKEISFSCGEELKRKEEISCICRKKHIDLRYKIKWQTQFDPQWGDNKKQNVACWKTSQQILTNSGLGKLSGYPDGYIALSKEINKHTKLEYLSDGLKEGIKYIDSELDKGHPILIGVNHDLNYRGEGNNDHTTDHFVVVIGRGCDIKPFYLFYDVGTRYKEKGMSDFNKLYVYENKIEGKTAYDASKTYTVAQIRRNR
ncbi:hypothetical protein [Chryseobacterium lineare]